MPLNVANGRFDVQVQFAATDLYGDLLGYFQRPKNYGGTHVITGIDATDSGGSNNTASGDYSTVGGGYNNTSSGDFSTVGGGDNHIASGDSSTVGGGGGNTASSGSTVAGGVSNTASGSTSTVAGGFSNTASGFGSTVVGGQGNVAAGDYSVAMGHHSKANGDGSFSFADNNIFDFNTNAVNSFRVRATGGVRFVTGIDGTGATTWSCLATDGNSWSCSSDRNLKQDLAPLDGRAVLNRLAAMPVYAWSPKGINAHVRHYGPMAQDFMAAFGLGDDNTMIGMQDADGVALAAIQGLHHVLQEKNREIARLKARSDLMERKLRIIEAKLGLN
jgi:hypothetical protein